MINLQHMIQLIDGKNDLHTSSVGSLENYGQNYHPKKENIESQIIRIALTNNASLNMLAKEILLGLADNQFEGYQNPMFIALVKIQFNIMEYIIMASQ